MLAPVHQIDQIIQDFLIMLITTDVDWESKPSSDVWSKKEILGHLADSANNNLNRFIRCTYEQNFKLVYLQNDWVAVQHYQQTKVDDLLTLWRLLNKQISRVLSNYPDSMLQNTCDTGKDEVSLRTVEWLAADYVQHLEHHLKQILA
ncbi:DinB family protein [Mucilaginibacter sp. HMF5004]|uniref:DinB family protein n=1 Tax=Mucilaginibacter rivuli TaxID=2857527 RepID=UPI001C5F5C57|nr:DinB family protein [Mucilaginibacter rivuli]MBW4891958.1 DinB family protein [Mucilaginibacter rivuli]